MNFRVVIVKNGYDQSRHEMESQEQIEGMN